MDPSLPKGPMRRAGKRPLGLELRACSFTHPVCVEPEAHRLVPAAMETLRALELAYSRLTGALDLPRPRLPRPGSGEGLLALVEESLGETTVEVLPADLGLGVFDTSSAVCRIRPVRGMALERASSLCVGEAIALRLDPGMSPHLRRAYATYLWWLTGSPTAKDWRGVAQFQETPHAAALGRERSRTSEGAALFFEFFEGLSEGTGNGSTATALVARAASSTPAESPQWHNEPDVVDVLRSTLDGTALPWPRLLGAFSRSRVLLGLPGYSRPGTLMLFDAAWSRPTFDWQLQASTLPRRLLVTGMEPTGSTFLRLEIDAPFAPGEAIAVSAECEGPSPFVWEILKLQRDGRPHIVVPVAFREHSRTVERTISELQDTRVVLIAGTSAGGLGRALPFDPDIWPYEPRACAVSLARLTPASHRSRGGAPGTDVRAP